MADRKRDKETTRQRLLELGRQRLIEQGLPETLDVRLTAVLDDAGLTTGAAYHIWPSQAAYLEDLALYVAEHLDWADQRLAGDALATLHADAGPEEWVAIVAESYFRSFVARDDFFVILRFWGIKEPSEELSNAIRNGYQVVQDSFVELFQRALTDYDLEVKPPLTVEDLCIMTTMACEGAALRARFEPERYTSDSGNLFRATCLAIYQTWTQPVS